MEASYWERLTVGKLGLVLMGGTMLSKCLIQFSVDGCGCVPSHLFDLRPNYGGGDEDNGDLLQKVLHCFITAPDPRLCWRLLDTRRQVWVGLSRGHCSFLLGPGAQGFVCALQESPFPVLCKFSNQIPLPSKVKFPWGFSVPLPDPQVGRSLVNPRTFLTVR